MWIRKKAKMMISAKKKKGRTRAEQGIGPKPERKMVSSGKWVSRSSSFCQNYQLASEITITTTDERENARYQKKNEKPKKGKKMPKPVSLGDILPARSFAMALPTVGAGGNTARSIGVVEKGVE